jgi:hypothetical protein
MTITGLPKKISAIGMMIAGVTALTAHAGTAVTGSVETGYNFNFNGKTSNIGHAYDLAARTFTLNNAHLAIGGSDSASGLGWDVESDLGTDAIMNNGFDWHTPNIINLQEAYLTYAFGAGKAFGLKAGKYATYEGIEVIENAANPTITRGFLYTFAEPVTHTGLELSWASSKIDAHVGMINGWDNVIDNNKMMSFVGKLGVNMGDPLALTVSGIWGPEQAGNTDNNRLSLDATGVTKVVPKVDLWFQGNYGMEDKAGLNGKDASWFGFGLQPLVHLNDMFGIGLRYEFLYDDQLSRTGSTFFTPATLPSGTTDLTLQNISVAPTAWLTKMLMARLEWRMDFASEKIYIDGDSKATSTQMELAGDLIASF